MLKKYLRINLIKDECIHIFYMFYDKNSKRLSKNFPHTLIYNKKDIIKFWEEQKKKIV